MCLKLKRRLEDKMNKIKTFCIELDDDICESIKILDEQTNGFLNGRKIISICDTAIAHNNSGRTDNITRVLVYEDK